MKYSGIIAHWGAATRTNHYLPSYQADSIYLGITPEVPGLSYSSVQEASAHIVLDGYIQNREALIKRWNLNRDSDSASIALSGYLLEGERFIDSLKGPFSLIIFANESKTIITARDALGQRPLFYFAKDNECIFASSIAQIHALKSSSLSINYGYLAEYMMDSMQSPEQTCWNEISRLPPATMAVWSNNTIENHRYWSPDTSIISNVSFDDAASEFFETLTRVVSESPYPNSETAVSFSGGLDSSAIAASAKQSICPSLITLFFEEGAASEVSYIDSVLKELSLPSSLVYPVSPQRSWMIDQIALTCDLPTEPNGWLTKQIRTHARNDNISLIYSGYGGDELLTGWIFQEPGIWSHASSLVSSCLRNTPGWQSALSYAKRKFPKLRWYPDWCSPAFFSDTGIEDRFRQAQYTPPRASAYQQYVWKMLTGPHNVQLRDTEQRESMADRVIQQYPFLSQDVVELVFRLPVSFFTDGIRKKLLLRKSFSQKLPKMLLERDTKAEFSHISIECINTHLATEPNFSELSALGWFDIPSLQKQYSLFKQGDSINSDERTCSLNQLWKILAIEEFLSRH